MTRGVGRCQPFHDGQTESGAGTMIDRPQPCDLIGEAVGLCDRNDDRVHPHPGAGGTRGRDKARQYPTAALGLRDQPLLRWPTIGLLAAGRDMYEANSVPGSSPAARP